jgi:hypothetical protein
MSDQNNGSLPPLIQGDALFSNVVTTSKLNEYFGKTFFKGPVSFYDTTTPLTIAGTETVAALNVLSAAQIGINAGATVSIGTTSASLIGFYGHSLSLQPTAAGSAAVAVLLTGTSSNTVTSSTTFGGYTLQQLVTALQATGIIA